MTVLIITNIILAAAIGLAGIAMLAGLAQENRPLVIKEAKALREYYEGKFKDMAEKTEKAERQREEYKGLYEHELQRNGAMGHVIDGKAELEAQVKCLTDELSSCEDRISDMAQENAHLKQQIKALEKPKKKGMKK